MQRKDISNLLFDFIHPHPDAGISATRGSLAQDLLLVQALKITPEEWQALASLKLPGNVTKEGYMQFLITFSALELKEGRSRYWPVVDWV